MTPIQQHLDTLAKRLSLTPYDEEPEENILNEIEKKEAIAWAIERAKDHYRDRHLSLGDTLEDVLMKISEIDWNEMVDTESVLKTANSNKHYDIWLKKKREEERIAEIKLLEEIRQRHTAKFIYSIMAWTSLNKFGKQLIVNDYNRKLITTICFFLSNDERFETELGFSFKKGLLIRGISGLGKTYLFDCVKDNELNPIAIYSMLDLTEKVKEEGYLELPVLTGITYLDDVGTEEPTVNHYGTKIHFFKSFIEKYYLHNKAFNKLIISTNNTALELEAKYGFRVRSRLKDMFNIVDVSGFDMRGK